MNKLIYLLFFFAIAISTVQAISCYHHFNRCTPTAFCLNETTKRNCTNPNEQFCFKDDYLLGLATRGCAELGYCNASLLLGTRHCCDTDYCNHAISQTSISCFIIIIIQLVIH